MSIGETKVIILDKATRKRANVEYVCEGCSERIKRGRPYINVRVRVGNKEIKSQHWHIECLPL